MASPVLSLDADQQTSAVDKGRPQDDRWRSEEISTHRGQSFMLLVVVDGEGETAPGEAASLAVEIAFAEARLRRDDPLPGLLAHLLRQMNEVVFHRGKGDMVGVTLAAIQADEAWMAQAGSQTRCYRVRGDRSASLLTSDNDIPLGRLPSTPISAVRTHKLRRGDKLVLCSDGLYAGNLVSPTDIAKIDRYKDVKGAARHLSALAMGRNVRDNVTVVVAAYGRKSALTFRLLTYFLFATIAATLIIAVVALALQQYFRLILTPRPPDWGVAVLAEGEAEQVEQFQTIEPVSDLNAEPDSPIHLSLKRCETLECKSTLTIPNIDLFFGPGAALNLAAIDVEGFTDPDRGIREPTNLTEVSLFRGKALLLSQRVHTFYVWFGAPGGRTPFIAIQRIPARVRILASLGVKREGSQVNAYCLRGSCSINFGTNSIAFPSGTKTSFSIDDPGKVNYSFTPLDPADQEMWLSLCTAFQTDPEDISGACRLLAP